MKTVKKPTKAHKGKKVIKAHEGMAHVPKPSASKAKGTAGATPRRRSIGLPQQFRGGRNKRQAERLLNLRLDRAPNIEQIRAAFGSNPKIISGTMKEFRDSRPTNLTPKQIKAQKDAYERQRKGLPPARDPRVDNRTPRRLSAPVPKAPAPVRRAPAIQEPKIITQPKPAVRPPKIMDGEGGRGTRPVFELPNKGRGKNIRRPKPQVRSAQAPRTPMVGKPITRTMQQGGYVSRAKYGIVDNLNKNK